jgi:hypothetical protein
VLLIARTNGGLPGDGGRGHDPSQRRRACTTWSAPIDERLQTSA